MIFLMAQLIGVSRHQDGLQRAQMSPQFWRPPIYMFIATAESHRGQEPTQNQILSIADYVRHY